jgi:hypothetical protein
MGENLMSATSQSFSKYEWGVECIKLLREIYNALTPDATLLGLINKVELAFAIEADTNFAVGEAVRYVQANYTPPATFSNGALEFAFQGMDGRIRLGALLDQAHGVLV